MVLIALSSLIPCKLCLWRCWLCGLAPVNGYAFSVPENIGKTGIDPGRLFQLMSESERGEKSRKITPELPRNGLINYVIHWFFFILCNLCNN